MEEDKPQKARQRREAIAGTDQEMLEAALGEMESELESEATKAEVNTDEQQTGRQRREAIVGLHEKVVEAVKRVLASELGAPKAEMNKDEQQIERQRREAIVGMDEKVLEAVQRVMASELGAPKAEMNKDEQQIERQRREAIVGMDEKVVEAVKRVMASELGTAKAEMNEDEQQIERQRREAIVGMDEKVAKAVLEEMASELEIGVSKAEINRDKQRREAITQLDEKVVQAALREMKSASDTRVFKAEISRSILNSSRDKQQTERQRREAITQSEEKVVEAALREMKSASDTGALKAEISRSILNSSRDKQQMERQRREAITQSEEKVVEAALREMKSESDTGRSKAEISRGTLNRDKQQIERQRREAIVGMDGKVVDAVLGESETDISKAETIKGNKRGSRQNLTLNRVVSENTISGSVAQGFEQAGSSDSRLAPTSARNSRRNELSAVTSESQMFGNVSLNRVPQEAAALGSELGHVIETIQFDAEKDDMSMRSVDVKKAEAEDLRQRKINVVLDRDVEKIFSVEPSLSVAEAKGILTKELKTIVKNVVLTAKGRRLNDSQRLGEVGDLNVALMLDESTDSLHENMKDEEKPKVIEVLHRLDDGTWKRSKVNVFGVRSRKQYIGGYRNKKTGQLYYHVICQTDPRKPHAKMVTREVQTNLPIVDSGVNTSRSGATQTFPGLAPTLTDKIVRARPYLPYNEEHKTMVPLRAAQIIQRAWRKFSMRRFFLGHFGKLAASLQDKATMESNTQKMLHERRIQTMIAACFPSFRSHFSDLITNFNIWARNEAANIASKKTGFARKVALSNLLTIEQKMLYSIETQRLRAVEENLRKQAVMVLEGTARSRARVYSKGNVTIVDDLNIQKAKRFKEAFGSYTRTDTTPTERLEILNCLRRTLYEGFGLDHPTALDLVDILDQEIDLITIGVPNSELVYLRKRFETKYLHFMKDPEVNPQAKYYRKSHVDQKKYGLYRCKFCQKYLPPSLMFKHVRMRKFGTCMSCAQLQQNNSSHLLNLAPYKRILEAMRAKELERDCRSAIPFLLQPLGTYFLVNVVWNGKSVLSENSDLSQLCMARWLPDQDWSVWNMVLLTEREAGEHELVQDPLKHYSEDIILNVRTKNILGRMHFMDLVDIDKDFKFNRPKVGTLPSDFLLYVNKGHEKWVPSNKKPEFFRPAR